MQAYRREVQESNLQHALSCYLLDSDLHAFVRGLLGLKNTHCRSSWLDDDVIWSAVAEIPLDQLAVRISKVESYSSSDVQLHSSGVPVFHPIIGPWSRQRTYLLKEAILQPHLYNT